jgi:hypothetical protein
VVQAAAPRPDGGRISQQTHFHGHIPTQSTLVPAFQAKLVHFPAEKGGFDSDFAEMFDFFFDFGSTGKSLFRYSLRRPSKLTPLIKE